MPNPTYILVNQDSSLDQSRYLRSDASVSNIQLNDNGADAPLDITTIFNLGNLAAFNTLGLVTYTNTHTFSARAITSSNTIDITNPSGTAGNVVLDVIDSSSVQKVDISIDSVSTTLPQSTINFIPGNGISINATDGINATNVTIDATIGVGTVTEVTAASTTGLTVNVTNPTSTPHITIDVPAGGAVGQVLTVNSTGPQTLHWTTPIGGGGTVTSIGIASTSGLNISGSPVTISGVIDVDLPIGSAGQVLAIDTTGPQTLHWVNAATGSVTSVGLTSTSGLAITGSPITTSGDLTVDLPTGSAGQVLAIDTTGPQVLHWINVGTVTSVGASSTTGLTITGSPITSSGAFTIDLPAGGVVGEVLAVATTGPQTVQWVAQSPGTVTSVSASSTSGVTVNVTNPTTTPDVEVDLPIGLAGQVLSIASAGPQVLQWINASTGTVTSVAASSTSGLTIGGSPITSSGTLTINLPTGSLNQVLSITGTGPQTLGWITPTSGTVTSVAASSTTGLTIGGSPVTSSGTLTINLPTGTSGQVLSITGTGPQTLGWINAATGTVTSVGLTTTSGLTITGSPVTSSGSIAIDLPAGGTAGQVLAINTTGPQTLHWISAASGTVTSVAASSTSGLTIGGSPITSSGTLTINLPTGSLNQVLSITGTGPQTLGWVNAGTGTVTSVGVSSSTGLTIGSSPVTSSGTITVDLPSGGTIGQVLNVTGTGPQTVGWTTSLIRVSNNVLGAGDSITFPSSATTNPNMLIGRTLGKTNFTGGYDVLVGIDILTTASASSGNNNCALGYQALRAFTSGGNNIGIGYQASDGLTTASFTTVIGSLAGGLITSSSNNTVMGYGAMLVGSTAENTVIGSGAYGSATSAGTGQNTVIGRNAGTLRLRYDACTFLGYAADATVTALSNASAIGANAQVTTSNSMVLGADINVGIGTASPTYGVHLGAAGTNFKPAIHFTGTTTPTTPSSGNNVLWSASSGNTGSLNAVSGNARYTGMVPTFNTGGSAPTAGTTTLNGTTPVTVTTSAVKTGSTIMLTHTSSGSGVAGVPMIDSISNGVSFNIVSSLITDLRGVQWWIVD